jgi:hypothetical protein
MTERTITEQELKNILIISIGIDYAAFNTVLNKAFPPIFKPKEGEAIWASLFGGDHYRLRVFSHMSNGEYVCFDNSDEDVSCHYSYAKPQTPRNKGE